jgi:hypothetical protein
MPDVAIFHKNFSKASHTGLGIAALNNSRHLSAHSIPARVHAVDGYSDLKAHLANTSKPPTHVLVSALWVSTPDFAELCKTYPKTQFYVVSHSNVAFLSADPQGTMLLREGIEMEKRVKNFHVAGNSQQFCHWIRGTFHVRCAWFPNMYVLPEQVAARRMGDIIKVGSFGATRAQKNMLSNVAVALQVATLSKKPLEVHINSGRTDGGTLGIIRAIEWLARKRVELVQTRWTSWEEFKKVVSKLDVCVSLTSTESFSMVTADALANGIPSVCSRMIPWVPGSWYVDNTDDISAAAELALWMVEHPAPFVRDGVKALAGWNERGIDTWKRNFNLEFR